MNIWSRKFQATDMKHILTEGIIECGLQTTGNEYLHQIAIDYEEAGLSVTVLLDEKIMGCGGVTLFWPGVGEMWAMFSPDVTRYPIETVKQTLRALNRIIEDNKLHRVQCYVRSDLVSQGFVKALGFKEEYVAKKFTHDKKDCTFYSIVR